MTSADIVIAGAGPAGIAAAFRASASKNVVVIDDNPAAGGQVWRGMARTPWAAPNAVFRFNRRIISADAVRRSLLLEDGEIRYGKLIIATGARELFLPFPGWTLPNVFGAGGIQALVKCGLPVKGKKIVVAGTGPLLLAVAAYLKKQGAIVPIIAEQAPFRKVFPFALRKTIRALALRASLIGVRYATGCWVEAAEGDHQVRRLRLRDGVKTWSQECDYLAVGYGLCPNTELASLLGCGAVDDFQQTSVADVYCAGEVMGIGGVDLSITEGQIAGYAASDQTEAARALFPQRRRAQQFAAALNKAFKLRPELQALPHGNTIVCRCEDVTFARLQATASWREAKLQTRLGMGPCQGRVCGPATQFLFGWQPESVRPPIFPARIASFLEEGTTK